MQPHLLDVWSLHEKRLGLTQVCLGLIHRNTQFQLAFDVSLVFFVNFRSTIHEMIPVICQAVRLPQIGYNIGNQIKVLFILRWNWVWYLWENWFQRTMLFGRW